MDLYNNQVGRKIGAESGLEYHPVGSGFAKPSDAIVTELAQQVRGAIDQGRLVTAPPRIEGAEENK
jgi:hypothetical protein